MTLLELFRLIKKHLALVVVLPLACAVVMGAASVFVMSDTYTAQTSMYILARAEGDQAGTNYSDLNASQMIANDVARLLQSDVVLKGAAQQLSMKSLADYSVSVSSETTSRVITLSVTGPDAAGTARVANAMASEVSDVAREVQMAESVNVIDVAEEPSSPSGPNRILYTAVAFLAGLFAAVACVVIMDMVNTRVRNAEDAEELLGIPVIGWIPERKDGE